MFGMIFALGVALYFLPSIIGARKRNAGAIFVLNLFLGWTLVGWVVALVWALTTDPMMATGPVVGAPRAWGCVCGAPLRPNQNFCSTCGARIGWPATH